MTENKKPFNLRNLYLYAASFVSLLFFLFGGVTTARNLAELLTGNTYSQSYFQFRQNYSNLLDTDVISVAGETAAQEKNLALAPDTPEIRALYEEEKQADEQSNRRRTLQDLTASLTSLILGLFFWLFFWRQTQKA